MSIPAAQDAPQLKPEQHRCQGLLLFRRAAAEAGTSSVPRAAYESICIGKNSSSAGAPLDLWRYTIEERSELGLSPSSDSIVSFTCLGSSVYQNSAGSGTLGTNAPPPFCRGLEIMHYAQAAEALGAQQQTPAAVAAADSTTTLQSTSQPHHATSAPSSSPPADTTSRDSTTPWANPTTSSSSNRGSSASTAPSNTGGSRLLKLFSQATELSAEAAERLQGQDPLWFAKAFAARARMNLEHMQKVGGQLAAAAAGRLPPEEDEQ